MEKITNFHTHTELCHHAKGLPFDYHKQATLEGCLALGFSDHCPYPESFNDMWPHIRMSTEESSIYINQIEELKQTSSFPVYLGYECEWDKDFSSWYADDLKSKYRADYLVLGSHWVTLNNRHIYALELEGNQEFSKYIDQTIQGMASKNFDFVAHPDIFMGKYKNWDENSKAWSKALIDAAKDLDLPLEINGLGITRTYNQTNVGSRFQYPYVEFWELVSESNVKVICNSDAHNPGDLIINANRARDFASRFNLNRIGTIF